MSKQQQLIPMGVGEQLRHRREELGLELEELARKLRIDVPVARAMESDRLEHLAPLYRRGYVRSYAGELGFDHAEIEQMLEAIGNQEPQLHTVFPEAGPPDQADRWIRATSYVLASLLVGTLAWQFGKEAMRLSNDVNEQPQLSINALPEGASEQDERGTTHIPASIASLEGIKRPGRSAGEQAWQALQPAQSGPEPEQAAGPVESVLTLHASGDSWVEIRDANGARLEVDLVRAGTRETYRGLPPFQIQVGNPTAVSLQIDGHEVDLISQTTNGVTQMTLDAPANR